ncbi:Actin-related protein 4 [Savitreella phatthalungensis]
MAAQYGGDEVGALVLDPGSHSTRAGYAGEDTPKCLLPSIHGDDHGRKHYGESRINVAKPEVELVSYMADGSISDFDAAGEFWHYAFDKHLRATMADHPLMITEPSWSGGEARRKTLEIAFEKLASPASYLLKNAVSSAFAAGKSTALVIDIGHATTSITPVYDGIVLKRGLQKQDFAGAALSAESEKLFAERNISVVPHFAVRRKGLPDSGDGAVIDIPDGLTQSYLRYQRMRIIEEFKENVLQVFDGHYNEALAQQRPARAFELPTGASNEFGPERFRLTERFFTSGPDGKHMSIQQLAQQAIASTEADIRPQLMQNVIVTGGSSLIPGMEARIQLELANTFSGSKLRLYAPGNTIERKCSSWLGGSILSSLGTFHQLWLSKQEYDEAGPDRLAVVEKRCR